MYTVIVMSNFYVTINPKDYEENTIMIDDASNRLKFDDF